MKKDNRITFAHGTARFTVQPANAQRVRDQLFSLDNAKPRKPKAPRGDDTAFPQFAPGMTTAEYLAQFQRINDKRNLAKVAYVHAMRAAPMLDPTTPEVWAEADPDYAPPPAKAVSKRPSVVETLRAKVAELEARVHALQAQLSAQDLL